MQTNGEQQGDSVGGKKRILREVNESIRELAGRAPGVDAWEFVCECDNVGCLELVSLTLEEFDARRNTASYTPILALHHSA